MFGKKIAFGINYWTNENASKLWREFDSSLVEKDFVFLRKAGVKWIRLFPTWNDFQPIKAVFNHNKNCNETVFEDNRSLEGGAEEAGVSKTMADRLEQVMNLANKYGFRVNLVIFTGFIDNVKYIPKIYENKNIFTDSSSLMWEQKYISYMVKRFKDHPALLAYELGNEFSALSYIGNNIAAQYNWTNMMCNAVKALDKNHPVLSGLAAFTGDNFIGSGNWQVSAHAQSVDLLTVHTASAKGEDKGCAFKTLASCRLFEALGEKQCIIEESLYHGEEFVQEDINKEKLLSFYMHGVKGYFFNFNTLLETEAKRIIPIISSVDLPAYKKSALCVMGNNLGEKITGLASAVLSLATAKDMGISFTAQKGDLADSDLYIVPMIENDNSLNEKTMECLLQKARQGAAVYFSVDGSAPNTFSMFLGNNAIERNLAEKQILEIDGESLPVFSKYRYGVKSAGTKVLASFSDGSPAIVSVKVGRGKVIISLFSVERQILKQKNLFKNKNIPAYYKVYSLIMKEAKIKSDFYTENPFVGTFEHIIDAKRSIISLMNYSDEREDYTVSSSIGYHVKKVLYGTLDGSLQSGDGVLFEIEKY